MSWIPIIFTSSVVIIESFCDCAFLLVDDDHGKTQTKIFVK